MVAEKFQIHGLRLLENAFRVKKLNQFIFTYVPKQKSFLYFFSGEREENYGAE